MIETFLVVSIVLGVVAVILLVVLVVRNGNNSRLVLLQSQLQSLKDNTDRLDRSVREEIAQNREETSSNAKQVREELGSSLSTFGEGIRGLMSDIGTMQKSQLDLFSDQLSTLLRTMEQKLEAIRSEALASSKADRDETGASLSSLGESLASRVLELAKLQKDQLQLFSNQLAALTQNTEQKLERMRETIEARMKLLQDDNTQKLELMRATVDEKLHATLEQRLGESFKLVSERLELVHKGLGEMQTLAVGVGDLKKVLTNVKARGTWGEVQLGALLEQVLTPEQYAQNVATKSGSQDRVEYAVKLPGQEGENGTPVWLPIDAKFPQEDYQKLVEAQEQANPQLADEAGRQLENRLKLEARTIKEKYIDPPHTTDFAIMFLPVESLYAEVLRRLGLFDSLQREHRVVVTGPTTLLAVLNSLQMGFRTLAIQKRASDVWTLLGAVKTEFGRFGEILDRTKKKLEEASTSIDTAATRSRAIERKLRDVQQLPQQDARQLLGSSGGGENAGS